MIQTDSSTRSCVKQVWGELGIIQVIRIRINTNARAGGVDRARVFAVLEQFGGLGGCTNKEFNRMAKAERCANQNRWKRDFMYGLRWIVGIVISPSSAYSAGR